MSGKLIDNINLSDCNDNDFVIMMKKKDDKDWSPITDNNKDKVEDGKSN